MPVTDEQSRAVCRKIDRVILPLLIWVYVRSLGLELDARMRGRSDTLAPPSFSLQFLQILDKSVVGYGAILGLRTDAGLVGNQYSTIGSAGYWSVCPLDGALAGSFN